MLLTELCEVRWPDALAMVWVCLGSEWEFDGVGWDLGCAAEEIGEETGRHVCSRMSD